MSTDKSVKMARNVILTVLAQDTSKRNGEGGHSRTCFWARSRSVWACSRSRSRACVCARASVVACSSSSRRARSASSLVITCRRTHRGPDAEMKEEAEGKGGGRHAIVTKTPRNASLNLAGDMRVRWGAQGLTCGLCASLSCRSSSRMRSSACSSKKREIHEWNERLDACHRSPRSRVELTQRSNGVPVPPPGFLPLSTTFFTVSPLHQPYSLRRRGRVGSLRCRSWCALTQVQRWPTTSQTTPCLRFERACTNLCAVAAHEGRLGLQHLDVGDDALWQHERLIVQARLGRADHAQRRGRTRLEVYRPCVRAHMRARETRMRSQIGTKHMSDADRVKR